MDKDCFTDIDVGWSGYCECEDGVKKMKKHCGQNCHRNCYTACKSSSDNCGKNVFVERLLSQI